MEEYISVPYVKTTKEHFNAFQKECRNLQKKWGLSGWELYFLHIKIDNCYARLSNDLDGRVVRIDFSTEWPEKKITTKEIKAVARHEMIHLVISRVYCLGQKRFLMESEMDESCEEAVRILEKIID